MVRTPTTCGCSSTAERQHSKLVMWVRFPSLTPWAEPTRPPALAVSCGTISSLRCVARPPGHMHLMLHGGAGLTLPALSASKAVPRCRAGSIPAGCTTTMAYAGAIVALSSKAQRGEDASPDDAGRWGHGLRPQGAALGVVRKGPLCWCSSMAERLFCKQRAAGSSPVASFHTRKEGST